MSLAMHIALAFVSGVIVEALYAFGVLFIGERRAWLSGALSAIWGAAFLIGVNESFRTWVAAAVWCAGLCIGTVIAVEAKNRWEAK